MFIVALLRDDRYFDWNRKAYNYLKLLPRITLKYFSRCFISRWTMHTMNFIGTCINVLFSRIVHIATPSTHDNSTHFFW